MSLVAEANVAGFENRADAAEVVLESRPIRWPWRCAST